MKKLGILALAAVMVMGLALSPHATINQTINDNTGEGSLWSIINLWTGLSLGQSDLEGATVLDQLGAGSYVVTNYAFHAGWTQTLTVPTSGDLLSGNGQINASTNIPFSEAATFGFTDNATSPPKNTVNQNGGGNQSSGFIFDLGKLGGVKGQYIVAFEDGGGGGVPIYGDSDYNDMVARVNVVPVPPSAILLGSGLLGLVGLRRCRKS